MFDQQGFILPEWPAPKNVKALVSTRKSFLNSTSPKKILQGYDCFNLALHVNDDANQVLANRAQLGQHLNISSKSIAWLEQVHGTEIVKAENSTAITAKADASTSTIPGKVCAIMTADCLPVLFCNFPEPGEPQQVAAAHAGWRGLVDGILSQTLAEFTQAANVIAWLGPAISQTHFEVGQEVYDAFINKNQSNRDAFIVSQNSTTTCPKWLASLTELAKIELRDAGIKAVFDSGICSYAHADLFYSYRRDGAVSGRMASLIMIT